MNDDVCLLEDNGEIRAGACGRVIGRIARPWDPSYLVIFEGDGDRLRGVRPEQIILAGDDGARTGAISKPYG